MEDVVIYLGSLGKHNTITVENLANAYKQWSLAHQRSTLYTGRGGTYPTPSWERAWRRRPRTLLHRSLLSVSCFGFLCIGQASAVPQKSAKEQIFSQGPNYHWVHLGMPEAQPQSSEDSQCNLSPPEPTC